MPPNGDRTVIGLAMDAPGGSVVTLLGWATVIRASTALNSPAAVAMSGLMSISTIPGKSAAMALSSINFCSKCCRSTACSPRQGLSSDWDWMDSIMSAASSRHSDASRKTTSDNASVNIPPNPKRNAGPKRGSRKRQATN